MFRKHKYDIILFVMVMLMTIFLSFILSINKTDKINEEDLDKLGRVSNARLDIKGVDKDNVNIIEEIIKGQSNISLIGNYKTILNEDGKSIGISDVYYNYDDKDNLPPLISGEFIQAKYTNNQNIIVVGKNVEKYCSNVDGKKYYEIDGVSYEVIGVMGYKNRFSIFDDICFKNLNINEDIVNDGLLSLDFYSLSLQNSKLIDIKNKIEKLEQTSITYFQKDINLNSTMSDREIFSIILIVTITFLLISYFWLKNRFKIIAISKIYGAQNNVLIYSTIFKFIAYIACGMVLGILIYFLCTLTSFFYNNLDLSIEFFTNTIILIVSLTALVSSLVILFILIRTIIKVSPLDVLNNMYNSKPKKLVTLCIIIFIIIQLTMLLEYCSYTMYTIKAIKDNTINSNEIQKKIYDINYLSKHINMDSNEFSIDSGLNFNKSVFNSEYIRKQVNLYIFKFIIIAVFLVFTIIISLRLYIESNINRYSIEIIFGQKVINIIRKIIIMAIVVVAISCILQFVFAVLKLKYGNYTNSEDVLFSFVITNICATTMLVLFIFIFLKGKLNKNNILELSKRRE